MLGVKSIDVRFGDKRVLRDVTLRVGEGESVAVLGPSGSGKSTLLRAVAGLVPVDSGSIAWDGEDITTVPTHLRGFGLMFQGYALFPHLDVFGNVAFGLRMTKVPDQELERRVACALELVGLDGFDHRSIADLSGGEKQRVALARTLAPEPRMIMLDEPLGALDRTLRERLMVDTRRILSDRGVTALVVTHDREEAAALSDRIALMREGSIVQTGTLADIVAHPVDEWVRSFLGCNQPEAPRTRGLTMRRQTYQATAIAMPTRTAFLNNSNGSSTWPQRSPSRYPAPMRTTFQARLPISV